MPSHVVDQKIIILNIEITSNLEDRENHPEQELKTVMICDDDQDTLNLFGKALKSKYNVILVASGKVVLVRTLSKQIWVKKLISYYWIIDWMVVYLAWLLRVR